jgi:hypothetical protein
MNDVIDDAVESLLGLFGENAPENAAADIAAGYTSIGANVDPNELEAFAEEVWERYNERIKHMEA